MWLFEAFFTAFRPVLSDSDETRIAPQAIYATVNGKVKTEDYKPKLL
jgi:hypothetical protein